MKSTSKALQVLDFITASGNEGVTFTEIQRFAYHLTYPRSKVTKIPRGWWCSVLCGAFGYLGLLEVFCEKLPTRKYIRNNVNHQGKPHRVMRQAMEQKYDITLK